MDGGVFDPFSERLARDVRNTLSEAFVRSLAEKGEGPFVAASQALRAREIRPVHEAYVRDRLLRYRRVLRRVREEGLAPIFPQMAAAWNEGLFFEVHELLEPVWLKAKGGRKMALKGVIQAAAAYAHLSLNRRKPGASLAAKAAGLLRRYGEFLPDLKNLATLLEGLEGEGDDPPRL